jgi:uncharacterized protein with PIN domain
MTEVCEKAIDRVRRLEDEERNVELCFKYLVCPKCGEDVTKIFVGDTRQIPLIYKYWYRCEGCGWEGYRFT